MYIRANATRDGCTGWRHIKVLTSFTVLCRPVCELRDAPIPGLNVTRDFGLVFIYSGPAGSEEGVQVSDNHSGLWTRPSKGQGTLRASALPLD